MDGVIVEGVDDGKGLNAGETLGGKEFATAEHLFLNDEAQERQGLVPVSSFVQ
jgi:hypothetical protein